MAPKKSVIDRNEIFCGKMLYMLSSQIETIRMNVITIAAVPQFGFQLSHLTENECKNLLKWFKHLQKHFKGWIRLGPSVSGNRRSISKKNTVLNLINRNL